MGGGNTKKEKYRHLFIFLFITIIPSGIWLVRNLILSGTFVGARAESSYTLETNLLFLFNVFIKWFIPIQLLNGQTILFMFVLIIGIFIGIIYLIRMRSTDFSNYFSTAAPIFLFMLLYIMLIVISSTTTAYDKISARLLSPVFVPIIILIFLGFDYSNKRFKNNFKSIVLMLVSLSVIGYWMQHQVYNTLYIIEDFIVQSGEEYSSDTWKNNTLINYLNNPDEIKQTYSFYSNAPEAIYILTNLETKWSPQKTLYNSPTPLINKTMLKNLWYDKNDICLIWFNSIDRKFLFTIDELHKSAVLKKIAQLKEGDIYLVSNPIY